MLRLLLQLACHEMFMQQSPILSELPGSYWQLGVSASLKVWVGAVQLKDLDFPNTTPSFRRYHVEQVAADVKETIGRVSDGPFDAEQNASIPTVNYEVSTAPSCGVEQKKVKCVESPF